MTDSAVTTVPASIQTRKGGRFRMLAVFALPALAVAGILTVALLSPGATDCGGPVPGCGNILNAGDLPVTGQAPCGGVAVGSFVGVVRR